MKKIISISTMIVTMFVLISSVYALQAGYGSSAAINVRSVDTDGDGVPDNQDSCPTELGSSSNNGCPGRSGHSCTQDNQCQSDFLCVNNKCTKKASDTDSGTSYQTQGTCVDSAGSHADSCVNTNVLREYYVSGNSCTYTDYNCKNIGSGYSCQSGACVLTAGSISTTIKDTVGNPVSGATVTCDTAYSCVTDSNGQCTIPNVPAGTYTCTASKSGYQSSSQNVNVVAGQSSSVNFAGNNAVKQNCALSSVSISSSCTRCTTGNTIQMSASVTGDCSSVNYLQIDAKDSANTCKLQYFGGDMQGITSSVSVLPSTTTISGAWNISSVPNNCAIKTVNAVAGGLYVGGPPGTGTNILSTTTASGSFKFGSTACNNNNKCDYPETQQSCSSDCLTSVVMPSTETAPGEVVSFAVEFNDSQYVTGHNVKLDINILPENIQWTSSNGCSLGGTILTSSTWPAGTVSKDGYWKTTTTCTLPLTVVSGTHTLKITPTIY